MRCSTPYRARRTVASAAVLLLGVGLAPAIASAAGVAGRTGGVESVTAGKWGITTSVTSMVFTSNTFQTSTITNSGTVALSAESYSVTISKPSSGTPTFKVFECTVAWVGTKCSGGTGTQIGSTLNSNATTVISISTAMAVSGLLYLQVEPTGVLSSTTVSISPRITSPAQLRAPVKTNQ
jgi:hypothetical protein